MAIAEAFDGKPLKGDGILFVASAGKGLYWHLVNLLGNQTLSQEVLVEDMTLLPLDEGSHTFSAFMEGVKERLSEEELVLFYI